jgi:hypothetical protein
MHQFGQHDIGLHIDENLGLEAGSYMTENVATRQGSETTTTDPPTNFST